MKRKLFVEDIWILKRVQNDKYRVSIVPKVLLAVCMLLFSATKTVSAGSAQEHFLQANELYKERAYEQAYKEYGKIDNKSSRVHYNEGNCAFNLGKYGYALLHWRRAERDWGVLGRGDLNANIRLVRSKLGLLEKPLPKGATKSPLLYITRVCRKVTQRFGSFVRATPLLFLQLIFLLSWAFLFLYIRYLYRLHHRVIMVMLFACIMLAGSMLAKKYGTIYRTHGVVITAEGRLYSGPDTSYQFLGVVKEGQEGVLQRTSAEFYKVKIGSVDGWIHKRHFESV